MSNFHHLELLGGWPGGTSQHKLHCYHQLLPRAFIWYLGVSSHSLATRASLQDGRHLGFCASFYVHAYLISYFVSTPQWNTLTDWQWQKPRCRRSQQRFGQTFALPVGCSDIASLALEQDPILISLCIHSNSILGTKQESYLTKAGFSAAMSEFLGPLTILIHSSLFRAQKCQTSPPPPSPLEWDVKKNPHWKPWQTPGLERATEDFSLPASHTWCYGSTQYACQSRYAHFFCGRILGIVALDSPWCFQANRRLRPAKSKKTFALREQEWAISDNWFSPEKVFF